MKLYGHFFSSPANFVRLTASATDFEHDYHHIDLMQGEQKAPEFLNINPVGKVPALSDGTFHLFESGAICRYIAQHQNSELYPADLKARALVDQWVEFANTGTRPAMGKILFNKFFAPMQGIDIDERSMNDGAQMIATQLPIIESTLSQNNYLASDQLSLGDIAMIAAMEPFEMIGVSLDQFPAITKWRKNIMDMGFYKNVHAHYGAENQ